jgi:8-oxo-dGTP pyrophosphatase MutT (NUDIX family)
MSKNNNCNNCGKQGHQFHQCKLPITSFGIVLCRPSEKGIQYLMIRRKNSFGYIDFIRGKYTQNNVDHLKHIFEEMSLTERQGIQNNDFSSLWKSMWNVQDNNSLSTSFKNEELASQKKFENIKNGLIASNNKTINLESLINNSTTNWEETEWEFPKGRRNCQERELECALREFEEETGISKLDIKIVENLIPFEEIFIGSNNKSYKHKYFLGYIENDEDDKLTNYQQSEVSKLEWKTLQQCLDSIRPYNLEKKQLIIRIDNILQQYRLY